MAELEREHHSDFTNYLHIDAAMFHELLQRLTPKLMKKVTNCRAALQPRLKLAITLRFLASGATYNSLSYAFRVPHNMISVFVSEVLQAIVDEYGNEVMSVLDNSDAWCELSDKFGTCWNFHHACVEPLMANTSSSKHLLILAQCTITTGNFSR